MRRYFLLLYIVLSYSNSYGHLYSGGWMEYSYLGYNKYELRCYMISEDIRQKTRQRNMPIYAKNLCGYRDTIIATVDSAYCTSYERCNFNSPINLNPFRRDLVLRFTGILTVPVDSVPKCNSWSIQAQYRVKNLHTGYYYPVRATFHHLKGKFNSSVQLTIDTTEIVNFKDSTSTGSIFLNNPDGDQVIVGLNAVYPWWHSVYTLKRFGPSSSPIIISQPDGSHTFTPESQNYFVKCLKYVELRNQDTVGTVEFIWNNYEELFDPIILDDVSLVSRGLYLRSNGRKFTIKFNGQLDCSSISKYNIAIYNALGQPVNHFELRKFEAVCDMYSPTVINAEFQRDMRFSPFFTIYIQPDVQGNMLRTICNKELKRDTLILNAWPLGIQNEEQTKSYWFSNGSLYVNTQEKLSIKILDLKGRLIYDFKDLSGIETRTLHLLDEGIYVLLDNLGGAQKIYNNP